MQYPTSKSFNKGLREVPHGKIKEAILKLKNALGITSYPAFRKRRNGEVDHTIGDCQKIEAVFAEFGVADPWGE